MTTIQTSALSSLASLLSTWVDGGSKRNKGKFLQMREQEAIEKNNARRNMHPWNGKNEPDFDVETPWDGKE